MIYRFCRFFSSKFSVLSINLYCLSLALFKKIFEFEELSVWTNINVHISTKFFLSISLYMVINIYGYTRVYLTFTTGGNIRKTAGPIDPRQYIIMCIYTHSRTASKLIVIRGDFCWLSAVK